MRLEEGLAALKHGADLLGFVSDMPSGPGVISLERIAEIIRQLPAASKTVLLTSAINAKAIIAQHGRVKSWGIQLVDKLDLAELHRLRVSMPGVILIQVIHVNNVSAIDMARQYTPWVDFLLLDSGKPDADIRTLGGTGAVHDWEISRGICQQSSIPVLLAGGLNSDNLSAAVERVRPSGVDLCSGVRSEGMLDLEKLESFCKTLAGLSVEPLDDPKKPKTDIL